MMKCTGEAMSIEFCPLCRTTTNMIITLTPKAIAGPDGKMKTITIKTYHCESCGSFVRNENEEDCAVRIAQPDPCISLRIPNSAFHIPNLKSSAFGTNSLQFPALCTILVLTEVRIKK